MSFSVLSTLIASAENSPNATYTDRSIGCEEDALYGNSDYLFYQLMLIPSVIEFAVLSFMIKRKSKWLDKCGSRPGLLYPMNAFETKNRMSFVAAFGAISYLCYEVILNSKYIFPFTGHVGIRIFVILLSVICYGIIFMPIFVALTLRLPVSYFLGAFHTWAFVFKAYDDTFSCPSISSLDQFLVVLRNWPKLLAITYLAIVLPVRFLFSLNIIPSRFLPKLSKINPQTNTHKAPDDLEKIKSTLQGRYVTKIFQPLPVTFTEDSTEKEGRKAKFVNIAKGVLKPWIYRNNTEFKYSARILSVYFVCFILVYKISIEFIFFIIPYMSYLYESVGYVLEYIGYEEGPNDTADVIIARDFLEVLYYSIESAEICVFCACVVEIVVSVILIFHMISSYRKNLIGLYKGSTVHIPPMSDKSNANIMVGFMRYTGFQVGYTLWACIIQFSLFFLLFMGVATIVTLYRAGLGGYITDLIERFWPAPITAIVISVAQTLMAKFLFLEGNGDALGIDNRRGFFLATYFVFFYNTFLGLVSCLLRIIKAIAIGALFLGRLDHSTLPRRFQLFDPGFDAYVGFMHMENAHTNPIMLTFISILKVSNKSATTKGETGEMNMKQFQKNKRHRVAAHRWYLFTVLLFNPQLRVLRQNYLQSQRRKTNPTKVSKNGDLEGPEIVVDPQDLEKLKL